MRAVVLFRCEILNSKAITKVSAAVALIVIVVVAGLIGVYLYSSRPLTAPTTTTTMPATVPDFVKTSTFVYESGSTYQYLDPAVAYYTFDSNIQDQVYEKLLRANGNSTTEIIPWLAESYQQVSLTKYEFKLRQNITFQDGTPFNARSVWFGLNRLLIIDGSSGSGTPGSQSAWIIEQMLDTSLFWYFTPNQPYNPAWVQKVLALNFVQIIDPYTIDINIEHPTTQFTALMSSPFYGGFPSPSFVVSHDFPSACATPDCPADTINYTAYFDHIAGHGDTSMNYLNLPVNGAKAGTGPYYIDSANPTTFEVVLKAYPNYWGGPKNWSGPPISLSIKTVDYVYQPDLTTRILDLRAGKATEIYVSPADLYSVADREQWIQNETLVSVIPGATIYGPFQSLLDYYFPFMTNATDAAGNILKFQPFADVRFRLAVACAVNLTDANININNRLGTVANEASLPSNLPAGSWNPNIKPLYSYNLTRSEQLLLDAQKNPMTHFVDVNGHPYPSGTIDNSFGPTKPETIVFYNPTGDTVNEKILTIMTSNLNAISTNDNLGLTFSVADVPGGQQFTLAEKHMIYMYTADWYADYNHIIDYMAGFLVGGGTMPLYDNFNLTAMNTLFTQALQADSQDNAPALIAIHNQMEMLANQEVMYLYTFYMLQFAVMSTYLQGYFYNINTFPYFASYSYSTS